MEERIEIRDGKTYKAFYDEDGKQAAPAELVPEVVTQVKIDELAASKLFLTKKEALTAWVNTSHYKDILKAIIGRQNSALDRELCALLTGLIQEEIDSEDVTLSVEDGQYFITTLESVVASLPPLPEA